MPSFEQSLQQPRPDSHTALARRTIGVAVALAVGVGLVACGDTQIALPDLAGLPSAAPPELPFTAPTEPDDDIVTLADRMFLTTEGRELFYASQPQLVDADMVAAECARGADAGSEDIFTRGCFIGTRGAPGNGDRIFIFRPDDDRLLESMVTTAAHELLHAAYASLDPLELPHVDALVSEAAALVPADDQVHELIDWSVGDNASHRADEQFAYLGSQVDLASGFPAALEEVYARYFTDRSALVETHRRAVAVIDDAREAAAAAWAQVAATESENAQVGTQLSIDRSGLDAASAAYVADVERFNALPVDERASWQVTLHLEGTGPVTMSWEASLNYRWQELEHHRSDIEARAVALTAAEDAALALRAEAERLHADAIALVRSANPNAVVVE